MPPDFRDAVYCTVCGLADFAVTVEEHDRETDHTWKPGTLEEWYASLEAEAPQ